MAVERSADDRCDGGHAGVWVLEGWCRRVVQLVYEDLSQTKSQPVPVKDLVRAGWMGTDSLPCGARESGGRW